MYVFNQDKVLVIKNNINIENIKPANIIGASENLPDQWRKLPSWIDIQDDNNFGGEYINLRQVWHKFGYEIFLEAGGAWQFANWFRNVKLCSHCGEKLQPRPNDYGRYCQKCGRVFYAPLSPAVIVAVEKDNKLLLAHNASMPDDRYSIIAGFVEPGETLEQTVMREVDEEVSLKISDVKYFGSQPWPFPNSLMLGFNAKWLDGEIKPDGEEIVKAGWYSCDEIKKMNIPDGASIARRLIDNFISRH